jgi:hypothetical protein
MGTARVDVMARNAIRARKSEVKPNKEPRPVTNASLAAARDAVYLSMKEGNQDLDKHIAALRAAMAAEKFTSVSFEPGKLAQNNRQGRKLLQSYFKKRGVEVTFEG